jgi:hypothetical protein
MGLRPEYSLAHSEFNEFLFALVGEEKSGQPLTVLSALARLGLDPWEEAARLAGMSKDAATSALTSAIADLPEGDWQASDSRSIASRLVSWLPARGRGAGDSPQSRDGSRPQPKADVPKWLVWAALALAALALIMWLQGG